MIAGKKAATDPSLLNGHVIHTDCRANRPPGTIWDLPSGSQGPLSVSSTNGRGYKEEHFIDVDHQSYNHSIMTSPVI